MESGRSNFYSDLAMGWTMEEDSVMDIRQRRRFLASPESQDYP
jgi:hypothetical protein